MGGIGSRFLKFANSVRVLLSECHGQLNPGIHRLGYYFGAVPESAFWSIITIQGSYSEQDIQIRRIMSKITKPCPGYLTHPFDILEFSMQI